MQIMNRHGTRGCLVAASVALPVPPGVPMEDIRDANEWPAPDGDRYNTRVAHTTISSANVSTLGVAWTLPLTGVGANGADSANPVVAYLQDGASNGLAVRDATGKVLWTHRYNAPDYGPNGVTIADGRLYGVTATGVFALDATTGRQVWDDTHLATHTVSFDTPPEVAGGTVFVSSALTVWRFQTVQDTIGQRLRAPAEGAWDAVLIGPDRSVYAGIGNPYLSQQQAQATPSRELYTDSIVKLDQATGKLEWYDQATPDDVHDWDPQISPIYTTAAGRPLVLAAGKGESVFAFDPASGRLLWQTAVGLHNGHDHDGQLALGGKLHMTMPYTAYPGEAGGVQTNTVAADGVVYVPVDNLPDTYTKATARVGTANFAQGAGEMVSLSLATGQQLWATKLPQLALGVATVAHDLVFTATFTSELVALARKTGAVVWETRLPGGSDATLAIVGSTLLAGAGLPLTTTQHPMLVAYRLRATGAVAPAPAAPATPTAPSQGQPSQKIGALTVDAASCRDVDLDGGVHDPQQRPHLQRREPRPIGRVHPRRLQADGHPDQPRRDAAQRGGNRLCQSGRGQLPAGLPRRRHAAGGDRDRAGRQANLHLHGQRRGHVCARVRRAGTRRCGDVGYPEGHPRRAGLPHQHGGSNGPAPLTHTTAVSSWCRHRVLSR